MATLSPDVIGAYVITVNKWLPKGDEKAIVAFLDKAIAIALAESGGDTDAVSPTGDYGLWQINKNAHPSLFKDGTDWKNPKTNTAMAYKVYSDAGNSWSPWSASKSINDKPPAYLRHTGHGQAVYDAAKGYIETAGSGASAGAFLEAALSAAGSFGKAGANALIPGPGDNVGALGNAASDPFGAITGAAQNIFKRYIQLQMTILATVFAFLLIGLGVWFIIRTTDTGKKVTDEAKSAALLAATKGKVK